MSFSSRRRNYMLTPHRRDGLLEWMKKMLQHSFVLDALESTGADTFSHFEQLIDEHREYTMNNESSQDGTNTQKVSRLIQLVPTTGVFFTRLPLRRAFLAYDRKYRVSKRRYVCMSFNEVRQIMNLAQVMAFGPPASPERDISENCKEAEPKYRKVFESDFNFPGPKLITFDGDQTLYQDGKNFDSNPKLADYLYRLLKNGVTIAVVTAAGYEYQSEKYELRLSGLLNFLKEKGLSKEECSRFFIFGGECNYLLQLGDDFKLHGVPEHGEGGWMTASKGFIDSPANWTEKDIEELLEASLASVEKSIEDQNLNGLLIRKKRSVGLVPRDKDSLMTREALDEVVLRVQYELNQSNTSLPYCAFNGGKDAWVDVGNKRVGVTVLQHFLGIKKNECLHVGDQFLNTGNDYAARSCCPCIWITSPEETTYILKMILRLAGGRMEISQCRSVELEGVQEPDKVKVNLNDATRRSSMIATMNIYTGEMIGS
uniref:IMP-specific 5'-nucleotidase 1 n=1 Tax=Corethron hystrix TaxID=216773 RepID=A0A7S1FSJ5_9STRA|mmetsp:Transcript_27400/g.62915  ORF Transcript_27400/g.62915 Transcript_27400/m.62915 type:complete len:485 (+) Transcript_27400:80-1534(+)